MKKKILGTACALFMLFGGMALLTETVNAQQAFISDGSGCQAKRTCFGTNGQPGGEVSCTGTICSSQRGSVTCDGNTSKCG